MILLHKVLEANVTTVKAVESALAVDLERELNWLNLLRVERESNLGLT